MEENNEQLEIAYYEIELQCKLSILALNEIKKLTLTDKILLFYHVQGLLTSTSKISRILWHKEYQKLSNKLRKKLGILNDSVLHFHMPLRKIRNGFEHYDNYMLNELEKQITEGYLLIWCEMRDIETNKITLNEYQLTFEHIRETINLLYNNVTNRLQEC